jgi:hypothetical protein
VVTAPTLGPGATFTASGLPPGADFDAPTRTFRFVPAPDQAGALGPVRFAATNGVEIIGEDVFATVTEARLSVGGAIRGDDSLPKPGIVLRLTGRGTRGGSSRRSAGSSRR